MRQWSLFPSWVKFYKTVLVGDSLLGDFHDYLVGRVDIIVPEQYKGSMKKEHVHETSLQLSVLRILQHSLWNCTHGLNVKILHVVAQ